MINININIPVLEYTLILSLVSNKTPYPNIKITFNHRVGTSPRMKYDPRVIIVSRVIVNSPTLKCILSSNIPTTASKKNRVRFNSIYSLVKIVR